jgi:uncharacterized protein YndB with AHSA1/START domain
VPRRRRIDGEDGAVEKATGVQEKAMAAKVAVAERELVITRLFDAPRELVWRMWTDPDHARNWWGPVHHPAVDLTMNARPGGRWRHCLRSVETGAELWAHGVFREVVPPRRLVFTFAWEEEGERGRENVVTIDFAEENGRTRMTFRQTPFWSDGERDGHREGWSSAFDRLDAWLTRTEDRS